MKKLSRRNFLQASAAAGVAALVGSTGMIASAAQASANAEENCIDLKLGGTDPIRMASVNVTAGRVIGYEDQGMYTFRGIQYAEAKRFQSPQPIKAYPNGWQNAMVYGPVSPQDRCLNGTGTINGTEFRTPSGAADMVANETCQYLNVWTKSLTGAKPVLVFFHGGGLSNGASSELACYTGQYFAEREDAVFVSVNHRLNVLGFLDMSEYGDEYKNSAIAGIEDCVVALQWVHDNIANFGGDPGNVTILGQSGGGTKVTTLACMSNTVGLFNKVFVMSGAMSTYSDTKESGLANTRKLVDYLGLKKEEVAERLTGMTYEELYYASTEARCNWAACYGNGTFESPMVDENGTVNPYAAQRKWIFGTAFSEFNANTKPLINEQDESADLSRITDDDAANRLRAKYGDKTDAFIAAFRAAYPDRSLGHALWLNDMGGFSGLSRWGLIEPNGVLAALNANGVEVYNYIDVYVMPFFGGQTMCHTADIPFWFNSLDTVMYMMRGDEKGARKMADSVSDALAAFMANGDPSTWRLKWKPYTSAEHNTMVFDVKSECKVDFDRALYELMMSK